MDPGTIYEEKIDLPKLDWRQECIKEYSAEVSKNLEAIKAKEAEKCESKTELKETIEALHNSMEAAAEKHLVRRENINRKFHISEKTKELISQRQKAYEDKRE